MAISYIVGFSGKPFDHERHKRLVAKWLDRSESARVDIYLPICGEPIEMVKNTWGYVRGLKALHENVRVYVLDDKKSAEAKANAKWYGFEYITRPNNDLKKAGNLRNAFAKTDGEFILILDADFCPRPDFLVETLPYMFEDDQIAIVQTPQFFGAYDWNTWLQKGAGAIQELFYRLIQVNRDVHNGAICVGTCALYRREALEPFGGTAPINYSEDVHTGFQVITSNWKIRYIPVILAEGICPETTKQYFTQQYRWALGSISLFFSRKFWLANLDGMQRICYLSGMFYYMTTGVGIFLSPIPGIVMLALFPEKIFWFNLLFSVPSILFSTCFMWWWSKLPMTIDVLRARHLSYFSHWYALRDFLTKNLEEWKPTGAQTTSERYESFKGLFVRYNIFVFGGTFGLIVARLYQGHDPVNFILVTAIAAFNFWISAPLIKRI